MTLNWRKPAALGFLHARHSRIVDELKFIRAIEYQSPEKIEAVQQERLTHLLLHAWANTSYYREVLSDAGVVKDGRVDLEQFSNVPLLTKDIIRREQDRLKSKVVLKDRKPFRNSSGGSTGQPVEFWQDSFYWDMVIASKLHTFETLGKQIGEPEMKIWGSERDLFQGTIGWKAKLQNFLYNRDFQQCYQLPDRRIREIVQRINQRKPKLIWSYRDGIDVIASYINRHRLPVHRPAAIVLGGATIYPNLVEHVRQTFHAPVINFYGSREMGGVACQCLEQGGLHIASYARKVEVLDTDGCPVMDQEGELVITALHNYTMPMIRYRIGDRGTLSSGRCPCGRGFPMIGSISGRVVERFINKQGDRIDPLYFVCLVRVYRPNFLKRFQMVQETCERIRIKMILEEGSSEQEARKGMGEITEKIRLVMGPACEVIYEFVKEIPLTPSGKHEYIVSKVPDAGCAHQVGAG
jgi:phenylacetate-CoA ligase